ncbi:MAG: hypothetical protein HY002_15625 [Candidatus Rokubacteria bacterium]|nr:hypothetical protein [Candidatus Rokubacteria bacterium]
MRIPKRTGQQDALALGLEVHRVRGQLSYRAAARRVGVSPMALWKVEHGRSVRTATLLRVLRWLGLWPKRGRGRSTRRRRRRSAYSRERHALGSPPPKSGTRARVAPSRE